LEKKKKKLPTCIASFLPLLLFFFSSSSSFFFNFSSSILLPKTRSEREREVERLREWERENQGRIRRPGGRLPARQVRSDGAWLAPIGAKNAGGGRRCDFRPFQCSFPVGRPWVDFPAIPMTISGETELGFPWVVVGGDFWWNFQLPRVFFRWFLRNFW
jgi:hypothetical protein